MQAGGERQAAGPPRSFDELKALLATRHDALPKRLTQVAVYAVSHPDEIAFGTAASVAEAAHVQPSTLVRFAKALGYNGFSDLQQVFRHRLRDRWPDYGERLAALRAREAEAGPAGLLRRFSESSMTSLMNLSETVRGDDLDKAVDLLARAEAIYLLGLRRAFPVSAYLAYALGKLGLRAILLDHVGGLGGEQLAGARPGDALVAISFTPYTAATVELANAAAAKGLGVVAITDSAFSPLAAVATVRLDVVEADVGGFRSTAATFCLAMTLAVAAAEQRNGS